MFNMFKSRKPLKKYHRYTWLLGVIGFIGIRYFFSHDMADLFYFSFLSFFGLFFTAKLAAEIPDERYEENRLKARSATMFVPTLALFAIGIGAMQEAGTQEFVLLIAAFGWAATFITYALAFWYYEKH